ncbi:hypothetical protein LWF15_27965 [Kineosporia rhizophila]|uniref:hypothetical protein n=1 Tax=Kineosporia TaxID=49184 RepID=UPI000A900B5F|nr:MULTISPECIES: hypothetical protein [Kineosporia]MCE0539341.1 hypothetical protein [Kineosporia rhizophila]GLY19907.1 hypothetical protein Kisp01_69210 [Kineosporia sp. NBRC 101677]
MFVSSKRIRLAAAFAASVTGAGVLLAVGTPAQAAVSEDAGTVAVASAAAKPDYSLIPANRMTKAGKAKKGLDFGYIDKVTVKNGVVKIRFDRAEFYTGRTANEIAGGESVSGYEVVDKSSKKYTFTVAKKAGLTGELDLVSFDQQTNRHKITRQQLITRLKQADKDNRRVAVWLRHTNGDKGTVTSLAEQYIP